MSFQSILSLIIGTYYVVSLWGQIYPSLPPVKGFLKADSLKLTLTHALYPYSFFKLQSHFENRTRKKCL